MSVMLVLPNSEIEVRRIPVEGYLLGTEEVLDLELLARTAAPECRLAVEQADQVDWLHVSDDNGATWQDVPAACADGYELAPLTEGQRKAIKVKIALPASPAVRTRSIGLKLGLGTGT